MLNSHLVVISSWACHAHLALLPLPPPPQLQTWSKPGWPCGPGDGALVQLEVRQPVRLKRLFFFDFGKANATQGQLHGLDPERFALLPTLLR